MQMNFLKQMHLQKGCNQYLCCISQLSSAGRAFHS
jgi:hypothetical protein